MELFSEIYGCYFTVVSQILEAAKEGMTKAQIEQLVSAQGFYDSAFHLLPSLFCGEWELLENRNDTYFSKITDKIKRPLTTLESAWIKALLSDPKIRLFLSDEAIDDLKSILTDVEPLFLQSDFNYYDRHSDGDDYSDEEYIKNFRTVLKACKTGSPLIVEYSGGKGERTKRQYHPYKLCYSIRDDKFRLLCAAFHQNQRRLMKVTLNIARMTSVQLSEHQFDISEKLRSLYADPNQNESVVIEISRERNALERCMLQFASFERQTEYDRERDVYTCRISFDLSDETELLIRILSFGPVVKVLSPESFLAQVKARIKRQIKLNEM